MNNIMKIAEKIEKKITYTALFLFGITAVSIAADMLTKWSYALDPRLIVGAGKSAAGMAVACSAAALGYFLCRTLYVKLKKSSIIISPALDTFLRDLTAVLRRLHTTFGSLAVFFLIFHFYLIFFIAYGREFNGMTLSGFGAAILVSALALFGYMLFKNKQNSRIRCTHRTAAFLMAAAFVIHKTVIIFRV